MVYAQVIGHFGDLVIVRPVTPDCWTAGEWLYCVTAGTPSGEEFANALSSRELDALLDEANRAVAEAHAAVERTLG